MPILSRMRLLFFSMLCGATVANAYYIHPLVDPVARHFDLTAAQIGFTPAFNQIALAVGIFLLLPLGDRISNRRLSIYCVAGQCAGLLGMAFAPSYSIFLFSSTFLGFVTVAPYVIPAYVSRRVPQARLGEINGMLTTGVILGILCARVVAGSMGEYFGWQSVYFLAAALMAVSIIALWKTMNDGGPAKQADTQSSSENNDEMGYFRLIGSVIPLFLARPTLIILSIMQGLNFGIFLVAWLVVGLHLPAELGYGVDVVGYMALISIVNLFTTTPLGRWADKRGASRSRMITTCIQLLAICFLPFAGQNIWLMIPILMTSNIFGPMVDLTSRMQLFSEAPAIRTRLLSIYIVFMFAGGGFASWAGTAAYGYGGWQASSMLAIAMSASVVTLAGIAHLLEKRKSKA